MSHGELSKSPLILHICLIFDIFACYFLVFGSLVTSRHCQTVCEQTRLSVPDEGWLRRSGARHSAARHSHQPPAAWRDRHTPLLYTHASGCTPTGLFIELQVKGLCKRSGNRSWDRQTPYNKFDSAEFCTLMHLYHFSLMNLYSLDALMQAEFSGFLNIYSWLQTEVRLENSRVLY